MPVCFAQPAIHNDLRSFLRINFGISLAHPKEQDRFDATTYAIYGA